MDKSRGKEHRRKQSKWKPKSVKNIEQKPKCTTTRLDSNWDRYEKEDEHHDFTPSSSTDFSILSEAPITQGHHFQFKSDRLIAEETESKAVNNLFDLDLNMLRLGILTVPFYQRVGIEEDYFGENQIKFMKRLAVDSLIKYNELYIEEKSQKKDSISKDSEDKLNEIDARSSTIISEDKNLEIVENLTDVSLDLEDCKKSETVRDKSEDDLEQWLDEILDN